MTVSGPGLLLGAFSGSMALQQLRSVLMFIALVTNEGYAEDQGLVKHQSPCWYLWVTVPLGPY